MAATRFVLDLKSRIAAIVLVFVLACIGLLTHLSVMRLHDEFAAVLMNQQFAAVAHTAAEIEQKIKLRFDALKTVAREITPAMLADPAKIKAYLQQRTILPSLFNNGTIVVSKNGRGLAAHPRIPQWPSGTYTDIEYFKEAMATGKPALGKPRIGRFTKKPGVAFAVPISDERGRPAGVLVGFETVDDPLLFGQVVNASVGKTGWVAVNDGRYRLIAAISDRNRLLQPFPKPGVNTMLDKYAEGFEGSGISINSQGREVLSSAKQIGSTGWFAQMVLPTEEAFAPIQALKARVYSLAALLATLTSFGVWIVIRHLLKPLAAASADIRAMASGRRELRELPVAKDDEVGELLASFNVLFAQRRLLEEDLARQARTDALTGLSNRRHFMELAGQELARATRHGSRFSVLMLDVDHFKKINDTYGHQAGDVALQALADTCRSTMREIDTVARLGGEEFAVLLPATDAKVAVDVAERLRKALADTAVPFENLPPLHFTVSIGIASVGDTATNVDALLTQADHALYAAKETGRNRVCCAEAVA